MQRTRVHPKRRRMHSRLDEPWAARDGDGFCDWSRVDQLVLMMEIYRPCGRTSTERSYLAQTTEMVLAASNIGYGLGRSRCYEYDV